MKEPAVGERHQVEATSTTPGIEVRLRTCIANALPSALKTGLWLLKITVPVSFAVLVMKTTGGLAIISRVCEPLFALVGLPGEAAIVFVTSCLLNIYSCIAVMETLGLGGRTVTILALMCLISHNLIVECAVQKKTGSRIGRMLTIRLVTSIMAGLVMNWLLPADVPRHLAAAAHQTVTSVGFGVELQKWFVSMGTLCVKIMSLVTALMIFERILQEFGVTRLLSRIVGGPLVVLGLSRETAFLWIVANVLGLAYGAAVLVDNVERGLVSRKDADTFNHHVAVSHSLLEDSCLFAAIGVSVWWITAPRLVLAGIVVWLKRLADAIGRSPQPE